MRETLLDSLARPVFPAPSACPTRTLAATEKPTGNCRARRKWLSREEAPHRGSPGSWGYHVCRRGQLIHDGLSGQLHLADDASQEPCDLIEPPLQAVHQHAGHGQLEERAPLLQALSGPAFSRRQEAGGGRVNSWSLIGLLHSNVPPLHNSSP